MENLCPDAAVSGALRDVRTVPLARPAFPPFPPGVVASKRAGSEQNHAMKNRIHSSLVRYGVVAATALAPLAARADDADPIGTAVTDMGSLSTSVGAGATAILAVAMVFVGIKLARRLLGKV